MFILINFFSIITFFKHSRKHFSGADDFDISETSSENKITYSFNIETNFEGKKGRQ